MLDAIANKNFRWLFDAALDAQLICNQHGDIAASNPAAQTLFGRSADQLSRLRVDTLIDPIDAFETIPDTLSGAILHPRSGVTVRARTNREPPSRFESAFSPLDDTWILVTLHPSEPRHAQRALDEHQQRLVTLIDASPDYIYFKDGAGRWQIANHAALDLFQLGGIDYQGKTDTELAELTAACYRDALRYCSESDEAAWRHGEIVRSIEIVTTASGECRHADVYKIPLFEPDGQRKALVILGRDVTELEQARESLKASERFLSELLDAAPDCIMFKDAEGRYRFANTATSDTLGIAPELLLGKTDRELEAELPDHQSTLRRCADSDELAWQAHGPTRSLETVTMDDGGQRQIEFLKAPLFHPGGARKGLILFGRDITDKLAAARTQSENETLIRRLIDASPDFMLFRDAADRWKYANTAILKFLGLGTNDYHGRSDAELLPRVDPSLHPRFAAAAEVRARAWTTGEPARATRRFETSNGASRYIDFCYVPYFDADGRRYGSVGVARDVTDEKRVDEALRLSEQRLAQALWAADLGTWDWNIRTGQIEINPRWAAMLGYDRAEIEPTIESWWGRIHPEDLPAARTQLEAHLSGRREQYVCEMRMATKSGDWRWVNDSGKVIARAPNGEALRAVGTQQDIHTRKLAERALIESRERLAFAIMGGALGTWDWDLTTQALRLDDDWLHALGYAPGEVEGSLSGCGSLCHPEDYLRFEQSWDEYLRGITEYFNVELRVRTRQGEWNWYLSSGGVTDQDRDGKPLRASGIFMDISQRKFAEAALRAQRHELERLIKKQVASLTAAAIAHELNQPLNAVAGYSDAALRLLEIGNPRPERLEHALRQSTIQAHRAGQTMRDLLTLLHDGDTEMTALDLNQLIRHAAETLRADDQLGGHIIVTDLDEALPAVLADRIQIEKVLANLVSNGVDAMHAGGIEQGQIRIGFRDLGDRIEISVHDDGPGVDPRVISTLFEPFHTTKSGGLGMGLAVSRSMILAHGGELWLDTSNDAGALFKFTLPYQA
ncbi:MAG: PAS domain S-box protein [Thiotrichales bacterium]